MRALISLLVLLAFLIPVPASAYDSCIPQNQYYLHCPTDVTVTWNTPAQTVTIHWTQQYNHVTRAYVYPYPVRTGDPTYVPLVILPSPAPGSHTAIDGHPVVGQQYVIYELYENGVDGNNGTATELLTPATPPRPAVWLPLIAP